MIWNFIGFPYEDTKSLSIFQLFQVPDITYNGERKQSSKNLLSVQENNRVTVVDYYRPFSKNIPRNL